MWLLDWIIVNIKLFYMMTIYLQLSYASVPTLIYWLLGFIFATRVMECTVKKVYITSASYVILLHYSWFEKAFINCDTIIN